MSSSISKSGKSTTQWKRSSSDASSSSRPRWMRSPPSTRATVASSPAAKSTVEPGSLRNASSSRSERNFAIGERTSSPSYTRYARPFAPHSFAISSSRCSSARENARGATRKRTVSALGEDAELGAARHLGRVLDLEPEAKVRLVGPVPRERVRVGQALGTAAPAPRARAPRTRRRRPARARRARPRARRTPSRDRAAGTRTAGRREDPRRASTSRSGSSGRGHRSCRAA